MKNRKAAEQEFARICYEEWRCLDDVPGTRLRLRTVAKGLWEIAASNGVVLATLDDHPRWGRLPGPMYNELTWPRRPLTRSRAMTVTDVAHVFEVREVSRGRWWQVGEKYEARQPVLEAVDAATGHLVATKTGVHKNCKALATIRFQEHCLSLPVRGTNLRNAVMSAVDESGNTMLRLRALNDIEVIVHPAFDVTAEVRLFVAMVWGSLVEYFEAPPQGGGA